MNTETDSLPRLNNFKKTLKILWYIMLIIGGLVIVLITFLNISRLIGWEQPGKMGIEFTTPGLILNVDSSLLEGFLVPAIISLEINMLAVWFLLLYSLRQFSRIFSTFVETRTPFIRANVQRIKKISYAFFIYSVIVFTAGVVLKLFVKGAGSTLAIDINTSIPLWPLLCGVFILAISEVFSYGLKLQNDNDSIV